MLAVTSRIHRCLNSWRYRYEQSGGNRLWSLPCGPTVRNIAAPFVWRRGSHEDFVRVMLLRGEFLMVDTSVGDMCLKVKVDARLQSAQESGNQLSLWFKTLRVACDSSMLESLRGSDDRLQYRTSYCEAVPYILRLDIQDWYFVGNCCRSIMVAEKEEAVPNDGKSELDLGIEESIRRCEALLSMVPISLQPILTDGFSLTAS